MSELSPEVIIKELDTPGSDLWKWSFDRHYTYSDNRIVLLVSLKTDYPNALEHLWVAP